MPPRNLKNSSAASTTADVTAGIPVYGVTAIGAEYLTVPVEVGANVADGTGTLSITTPGGGEEVDFLIGVSVAILVAIPPYAEAPPGVPIPIFAFELELACGFEEEIVHVRIRIEEIAENFLVPVFEVATRIHFRCEISWNPVGNASFTKDVPTAPYILSTGGPAHATVATGLKSGEELHKLWVSAPGFVGAFPAVLKFSSGGGGSQEPVEAQTSPTLALFLDVEGNGNFSTNSPTNDIVSYIPGYNTTGSSLDLAVTHQTVQLVAAYVDFAGQVVPKPPYIIGSDVTFALLNTSKFKGEAMNVGDDPDLDFYFIDPQDPERKETATARFGADNTARVTLYCADYGGFTVAVADMGSDVVWLGIPADEGGNWMPDIGWASTTGQIEDTELSTSADEDDNPQVYGPPSKGLVGDGFTNFEEYRGFVVQGNHRRTNPFQKDLFISSNLATGIQFAFPNLPLAVHRVFGQDEAEGDEYDFGRRMNFNSSNTGFGGSIPGHFGQKALRVFDGGSHSILFGQTLECCGGSKDLMTPNEVEWIKVFVARHQGLFSGDPNKVSNEIRRTTAHEVGHSIHICHREAGDTCLDGGQVGTIGVDDSVMNSNTTGTGVSDPNSQYNDKDKAQIRLHQNN